YGDKPLRAADVEECSIGLDQSGSHPSNGRAADARSKAFTRRWGSLVAIKGITPPRSLNVRSQICVSRAKQSMESRPVKQACQLYKQHLSTAERPRVEPSWKGTLRRESLVRWNHEAEARVSHPSGCVLPPAFGHRLLHHP